MGYNEYDTDYYEPSELESILAEYKDKCKEILLSTIQNEINQLRDENESLQESNKELRNKVWSIDKLKQEIERDKQKYINEGIADYQRDALSGLRCGDIVWTIKTETTTEKCKHCIGTHEIEVYVEEVKIKVNCPHCNYSGNVEVNAEYIPIKRIISQITTSVWADNKMFKRHLYLKEAKGCSDTANDEFISDDSYGTESQAKETNEYARNNTIIRSFWLTEEDCLMECDKKKLEWLLKHK